MEYFGDDQLIDLVGRLTRLTSKGRLDWQASADDEFVFSTELKSSVITVGSRDRDDLAPHIFAVASLHPKIRLLQQVDTSMESAVLADLVEDLYGLVKRRALKLDELASQVFEDLDELES